jgi:hypothetical protein
MGPVDKVFFDNRERRNRMIDALKELDQKSALDGLGEILTSLNETNFYDAFNELFVCADEPSSEVCADRQLLLKKDEIVTLLRGLDRSPQFYEALDRVFTSFVVALGPHQNELKKSIQGFYDWDEFTDSRLFLVNRIFEELEQGIKTSTLKEWRGLLAGGAQEEGYFLWEWMNAGYMNADKFNELMTYPIFKRPELIKEQLALQQAVTQGMICTPSSENNYLEIDVQKELQTLMKSLREGAQVDFMFYLSQKALLLRSAETFCPDVRSYQAFIKPQGRDGYVYQEKYNVDFVEQLQATSDFILERPFFDLLKFLETNSYHFSDQQDHGFILLDVITLPFAQQFIKMNEKIIQKSENYNKVLFNVLQRLPREFYQSFDLLLEELEEDERLRSALVQLAKAWDFYSEQEKNFLFTFLDKHMEEDTKYYALFEFYQKSLKELPAFATEVRSQWFQDEQQEKKLYKSLRDLTWLMSGADVLKDFQSFFSRDHIIEIIKVITRGEKIKASKVADSEFLDEYIQDSHKSDFQLSVATDSPMAAYECVSQVLSDETSFYSLLISLPPACQDYSSSNIMIKYFTWMNSLGELLKDSTGNPTQDEIFFSANGLFSKRLITNTTALADSIDDSLDEGVSGLVGDISYHLYEKIDPTKDRTPGYQQVFGEFVRSLWGVLSFNKEKSVEYRNHLLKEFSSKSNEGHKRFWPALAEVWKGYGDYLEKQEADTVVEFSESRFRFPCHMFLNQNVGYSCPQTAKDILEELLDAVDILGRSYDSKNTPLGNILVAASADFGQPIPLNSPNASPYRLTLTETFQVQSDLTDKKRDINNLMIPYEKYVDGGADRERLTTMERIEIVIRGVSFRYNYLGVQYLNSVSQGDDYNDDVQSRKDLMEKCIKIPIIRCGKKMTNDQQRRGENALEAYDGLLDINNGRGLEPDFTYGNYMKALLSAIVGSSAEEAQEVRFFPFPKEVLVKHNGLLLGSLTRLAGFTHLGRWIQARFLTEGRTLDDVLNSKSFRLIDRTFLTNIPESKIQEISMRLTETLNTDDGQVFLTDFTRWLFTQSEKDFDLLEKGLGRVLTVLSHITPAQKFFNAGEEEFEAYSENSWQFLIELSEFGISNWRRIKSIAPEDFDMNEIMADTYNFVNYLYSTYENDTTVTKDLYVVINEAYQFLKNVIEKPVNNELSSLSTDDYTGYDYIKDLLKEKKSIISLITSSRDIVSYVDSLKYDQKQWNGGRWYTKTGHQVQNILKNSSNYFQAYNDYLYFTSLPQDCRMLESQNECRDNPHYDEVFTLLEILAAESPDKEYYFEKLTNKVFKENKKDIQKLLNEVLGVLKVSPSMSRQ